jgi:hypothetical protein
MNPILEELYYGHIHPFESIVHQDPDHPLNRKIYDLKLALQEKLPAEDVQALEDLVDLCCDSGVQESAASFEYGVKFGVLLMMKVLGDKGEPAGGED